MIDASCSRKSFLTFGLCTLATGLVGCSEDPGTTTRSDGGSSGSGGKGGSGGVSGGSGGSGGSSGATTSGGGGSGGATTGGSGGNVSGGSSGGGSGGASGGASGGGSGGTGGAGGVMCNADIVAQCSPEEGDQHTHMLIVTAGDITAGVDVTLTTEPDLTQHDHDVDLTADDFTTLKAGGTVIKEICGQGPHQFVIACANPPQAEVPDCP